MAQFTTGLWQSNTGLDNFKEYVLLWEYFFFFFFLIIIFVMEPQSDKCTECDTSYGNARGTNPAKCELS